MTGLDERELKRIAGDALEEDIGSGDITTDAIIPPRKRAKACLIAKENCIVCGLRVAEAVFKALDTDAEFVGKVYDGDTAEAGQVIAEVQGDARALLAGERTALNFLQRMSGISTTTKKYADILRGYDVKLLDTRKTTPGLRVLEKYAVRTGGGGNHRAGLYDAILIKDNHIKLAGMKAAVMKAKETGKRVEVEACSIDEVRGALEAGADVIMLDNMPNGDIEKAVGIIGKRSIIEVSGGIDEDNIESIAKLGVDWISVGRLTHSVPSVEISMEIADAK
ncbi:MAG: carboxylating nicotinate-nucleotide diphosphorylase [Candidatus Aenigmarchaeota archaeon]|nr:carboxylating nicotinate-nucleotide diphosphorylase [Candidatus Aenigmarchaeota archaeon]